MLTMPRVVTEEARMWAGLAWPTRMGPTGSAYPYEVVEHSVELFGREVIPRFDRDPEPRSARFRREAGERLGVA